MRRRRPSNPLGAGPRCEAKRLAAPRAVRPRRWAVASEVEAAAVASEAVAAAVASEAVAAAAAAGGTAEDWSDLKERLQ